MSENEEKATAEEIAKPTYKWKGISNQWDTRVEPNEHGLRLGDLNVGIYGEVPEYWDDQTRRPRGSVSRPGIPPLSYSLRYKHDVWADCAADLYEEAIQRQWIPATDVPWDTLEVLPEEIEKSVCQVCTELSQYANSEIEIISHWQDEISYGFHEVKQYLATVSFDCARHVEALRKRALSNGGGLGVESRGVANRMILQSSGGWTESVAYLYLVRGTYVFHLLKGLHNSAHNDAERYIYKLMLQDHARHLTYGYDHLKYAATHKEGQIQIMATLLAVGEGIMSRELDTSLIKPAMAIVFGGGVEGAKTVGMEAYLHLVKDFVTDYVQICGWLGIEKEGRLNPALQYYLDL